MKALIELPVLAVALALALAACGGSGGGTEGVAHLESTASSEAEAGAATEEGGTEVGGGEAAGEGEEEGGTEDKALAFSECMRSHGISDFPEPVEGRIQLKAGPGSDLNPESPAFQKATEACRAFAPSQEPSAGQEEELRTSALEFAECMRSHGVPNFPDPEVSGGGVKMAVPKGVDPESPTFEKANEACRDLMVGPGGETP